MAKTTTRVNINPADISISPTGTVTIANKKLATQLTKTLAGKAVVKMKPGGTSAFIDVNFGC